MELIELSNNNSIRSNNGEFDCTFPPKIINPNDQIYIKSAMISTIAQSPDQLYIDKDLTLSFKFIYYEYDIDLNAEYQSRKNYFRGGIISENIPRYAPYILTDYQGKTPIQSNVSVILPQGVYSPNQLCETITRLLSGFPSTTTTSGMYWLPQQNSGLTKTPNKFNPTSYDFGIVNTSRDYYNYSYVRLMSDGSLNINDRYLIYAEGNDSLGNDIQVGASQVSLSYNLNDNGGFFEWSFLHTPIFNPNFQPCTVIRTLSNNFIGQGFALIPADCGIIFTSLEPRGFWEDLGFDVDKVCCQLSATNSLPYKFQTMNFDGMTTKALFSIQDKYQTPSRIINISQSAPVLNLVHPTNDTVSIKASKPPRFDKSPYYLLEIVTNYSASQYTNGQDRNNSINSIISKGYLNNNFIISYSDDSVIYTHTGEPFVLSSARVRLLNALDKTTIDVNISNQNFIMLAINRYIPPPIPINQDNGKDESSTKS